ncbi:Mfa1 family fimbria major subunit [Segatella copri]|uniref:Mfa1 family fimbria major subunit n=1 Tax=Segatella copri TaxID=165179 RepID=UPI003F88681A
MKFFKFYSLALAGALMLGACSSSDDLKDGGATANEGKSYIAVNIKSVGTAGAGTRAEGDYTQGGGTYEDGTENERAISAVRFFFFNSDGSPYIMKNTEVNYKELENTSVTGPDHLYTIEGKTAAMLVIEGETKTAPAYMIAVVNPGTLKNLKPQAYRESQLRDAFKDKTFVKITTEGSTDKYSNFVMSNSVYSENDARVCASSVSGHVEENKEEAAKNPVDIYVERVVAKATTNVNTTNGLWTKISEGADAGKYKIKVGEIFIDAENKKDVYAVVQGWGLADENGQALLEKQIDVNQTNLTSAILGIDPWTSPDYHRCFWEASVGITPEGGSNPNVNHKFSDFTTQFGTTPLYTCPNTPTYEEYNTQKINEKPYGNTLTKVLVAAKLVYYDDDNNNNSHPADICKYRGMQILGAKNVLTQVAKDYSDYWTVDKNDPNKHILLAPEDLVYTREDLAGSTTDGLKSYEVRPVLKAGVKVYKKKSDGTGSFEETDSNDELNKELAKSPVQVRKEGMTYYYTPIRHLAETTNKWGYYGVVRNHSYRITINTISGFGTPVYNPEEFIVPVIPKDTETFLAARINVLSWRVVPSSVDLDATK